MKWVTFWHTRVDCFYLHHRLANSPSKRAALPRAGVSAGVLWQGLGGGSSDFSLVMAGPGITQPLFGEELIVREALSKKNKQGPPLYVVI